MSRSRGFGKTKGNYLTMKKVRRVVGSVIAVPLDDGVFGYGRVLDEPLIAFYNWCTSGVCSVDEIVSKPVAFKIWVMNHSITSGRWPVLDKVPLSDDLLEQPAFYKWDSIAGRLYITYDGSEEIPASPEVLDSLECAAVWEPEHVEERLRDHFAGRKCNITEELKKN